jgi:hypothetical protein
MSPLRTQELARQSENADSENPESAEALSENRESALSENRESALSENRESVRSGGSWLQLASSLIDSSVVNNEGDSSKKFQLHGEVLVLDGGRVELEEKNLFGNVERGSELKPLILGIPVWTRKS